MSLTSLEHAKRIALQVLHRQREYLRRRLHRYATRKYRCKPQQVQFDDTRADDRLKNATVCMLEPNTLGENDYLSIVVTSEIAMSMDELVGVLLHEYMHNWCIVRGKVMSCCNEHSFLRHLGDANA